jgi:hypothetical protein
MKLEKTTGGTKMTDPTIALKEHLYKLGLEQDGDFLRQAVEMLAQVLI